MFKKIINIFIDILFIGIVIVIIYYFYSSHKSNSLLDGPLPYLENYTGQNIYTDPKSYNINIAENTVTQTQTPKTLSNQYCRYYYQQLDYNSKLIYSNLEYNIDNLKLDHYTIDFSTKFNELLNNPNGTEALNNSFQSALDAFFYDHPELFYIDLTKITLITKSTTIGSKTTYRVSLEPKDGKNYLYDQYTSKEQLALAISQVQSFRDTIISHLSGDTYQQILTVHDTLIDLIEYDTTLSRTNTHNIYGALIEKNVVCEGYAKAFKYILDGLGIPCILVGGNATNSSGQTESHMWNYVQIDNNWYGVDVTWDDPIVVGGITKNVIRHTYFCKGASAFLSSHYPDSKISDEGKDFTHPTLSQSNY